jgi:hypothetical protein
LGRAGWLSFSFAALRHGALTIRIVHRGTVKGLVIMLKTVFAVSALGIAALTFSAPNASAAVQPHIGQTASTEVATVVDLPRFGGQVSTIDQVI